MLTMCSGKLLATVLSELAEPPEPPVPVRKPQRANTMTMAVDASSWPFLSPASKIDLIPI